jgi:type VI secretion system protein ImpC
MLSARAIDTAIAAPMRNLPHHPCLQTVEALWRTVEFLVTRLDLDDALQLHLFDVAR